MFDLTRYILTVFSYNVFFICAIYISLYQILRFRVHGMYPIGFDVFVSVETCGGVESVEICGINSIFSLRLSI